MKFIHTQFIPGSDVLKKYEIAPEKFNMRYESLMIDMNRYLQASGLTNDAMVNASVLGHMLVDYFVDVSRLKGLHPIDHLNSIKIVSYTSYWILKSKPIQVVGQEKELVDLNEKFVLAYILDFLSSDENSNLLDRDEVSLIGFKETLLYFLKYRIDSPYYLELMLIGFFAGQIYENSELENNLPPNDAD